MDRIHIRDLEVDCILGIMPVERRERQRVRLNLDLWVDLSKACRSDAIEDTLDYKVLRDAVLDCVSCSTFYLIEALAQSVADMCLRSAVVRAVRVTVDKPGALSGSRSVAVSIWRRGESPDA